MRATCPNHFSIFSILYKIVCVAPTFSLIASFRTFSSFDVLAALLLKSISVLNTRRTTACFGSVLRNEFVGGSFLTLLM
jgi:hypothetical protein